MSRATSEARIKKQSTTPMLVYEVKEREEDAKKNSFSLPRFQEILKKAGIHLEVDDGTLRIFLIPEDYVRNQTRYAGVRRKTRKKNAEGATYDENIYRYSDIVALWGEGKKEEEMLNLTGMPRATYYRHKKALLESNFYALYKTLGDEEKKDRVALKMIPYNRPF